MECNKDDAFKAREIAERKLAEKDLASAKKFAHKTQNMYPELEGVSHLLTIIDVCTAAEKEVNGDLDWYGILGVDRQADDETIRKQYQKLIIMLHPDKNKCAGAEKAFKLISDAWKFVSNKEKKQDYDLKTATKGYASSEGFSASHGAASEFPNFSASASPMANTTKNSTPAGSSSAPSSKKQKSNIFWTICRQCKSQFEYLRIYIDHILICIHCNKTFLAIETSAPTSLSISCTTTTGWGSSHQQEQMPSNFASCTPKAWGARNSYMSDNANFWSAVQAATFTQQAFEQDQREHGKVQATTEEEEAPQRRQHDSKISKGDKQARSSEKNL